MTKKIYELIDHTADLGIKIKGETLPELFSNAAYAMFDLLLEIDKIKPEETVKIKITDGEMEDIFVDWLRKLLLKFYNDRWAFKEFNIQKLDKSGLEAEVKGEKIDPSKQNLKTELKAVTYHGLKIQKVGGLWEAQIIFDI